MCFFFCFVFLCVFFFVLFFVFLFVFFCFVFFCVVFWVLFLFFVFLFFFCFFLFCFFFLGGGRLSDLLSYCLVGPVWQYNHGGTGVGMLTFCWCYECMYSFVVCLLFLFVSLVVCFCVCDFDSFRIPCLLCHLSHSCKHISKDSLDMRQSQSITPPSHSNERELRNQY